VDVCGDDAVVFFFKLIQSLSGGSLIPSKSFYGMIIKNPLSLVMMTLTSITFQSPKNTLENFCSIQNGSFLICK
jgi:hypothetical protein